MKVPSLEQLMAARDGIISNSQDLLQEARILYGEGHCARAYALAHLAQEEVSKLPILINASIHIVAEQAYDWGEFRRRFRSHRSKLRSAAVVQFMVSNLNVLSEDDKSHLLDWLVSSSSSLNDLKNLSLYVGFEEGVVTVPSEIVTSEVALAAIRRASMLIAVLSDINEATGEMSEPDGERLKEVLEAVSLLSEHHSLSSRLNDRRETERFWRRFSKVSASSFQRIQGSRTSPNLAEDYENRGRRLIGDEKAETMTEDFNPTEWMTKNRTGSQGFGSEDDV